MVSQKVFVDGSACAESTPIEGLTDQKSQMGGGTVIYEQPQIDYQTVAEALMEVLNDFMYLTNAGDYVEVLAKCSREYLSKQVADSKVSKSDIVRDANYLHRISEFITRIDEQHRWTEEYYENIKSRQS